MFCRCPDIIYVINTLLFYSANSLFALPNNQAYVYIMNEPPEEMSATALINNSLLNLCNSQGNEMLIFFVCVCKKFMTSAISDLVCGLWYPT